MDRIIEVDFSDNVDLDAQVVRNGAVLAAYATREPRPDFACWPMLFDNITIRLLGSDDFPDDARRRAAIDLTAAAIDLTAAAGHLAVAVADPYPLGQVATAHEQVDADNLRRVLLAVDD